DCYYHRKELNPSRRLLQPQTEKCENVLAGDAMSSPAFLYSVMAIEVDIPPLIAVSPLRMMGNKKGRLRQPQSV
ncbi:hypothetical protein, partial [Enterobacter asburiae]|uniref:hypothetical protein n=1 Tax=Enterobacter asburiae TaxID=61645 RepID=UPI003D6E0F58